MTFTVPYAYGSQRVTMEQLEAKQTVANCHPEFRRRMLALIAASEGRLGVGTAWRSPATQDAEYQRRIARGIHNMTPSSRSWHCAGAAVDFVGDLGWAGQHCEQFGLYQATWGGEKWHFQPTGLPHSRPTGANPNDFIGHYEIVGVPPRPPHPVPQPDMPVFDPEHGLWSLWPFNPHKPDLHAGAHGDAVAFLQGVLKLKAGQGSIGPVDGAFGRQTERSVRNLQVFFGKRVDGWVGHSTWELVDFLAAS